MKHLTPFDWSAFTLTLIGGLNWGMRGLNPEWNIVATIARTNDSFERLVYIVIGLSALWCIFALARFATSNT